MINSSEIFSTSDKSILEFEDDYTSSESIIYYRIVVENIFGKQTPGNLISTSMSSMPGVWDNLSVNSSVSD